MPDRDEDAPEAIGGAILGNIAANADHVMGVARVRFCKTILGPNTPIDVLTAAVVEEKPQLARLCIGEPIRSRTQIRELGELARAAVEYETRFVIGGRYCECAELGPFENVTQCRSMSDLRSVCLNLCQTRYLQTREQQVTCSM